MPSNNEAINSDATVLPLFSKLNGGMVTIIEARALMLMMLTCSRKRLHRCSADLHADPVLEPGKVLLPAPADVDREVMQNS
jgi:hypothetical protein